MTVKAPHIHSGMNLRDAETAAIRLGATVEAVRGTGERRVWHPAVDVVVVYNCRKKAASRAFTVFLRRLVRQASAA